IQGNQEGRLKAACQALFKLVGTGSTEQISPLSINILGEFNLAGEAWMIRRCHGAALNVVQCSGSMVHLAKMMKEKYGIPFIHVSYFGIEDTSRALYDVAEFFKERDPSMIGRTRELVREEVARILPRLREYKAELAGKRAAIYTGGA